MQKNSLNVSSEKQFSKTSLTNILRNHFLKCPPVTLANVIAALSSETEICRQVAYRREELLETTSVRGGRAAEKGGVERQCSCCNRAKPVWWPRSCDGPSEMGQWDLLDGHWLWAALGRPNYPGQGGLLLLFQITYSLVAVLGLCFCVGFSLVAAGGGYALTASGLLLLESTGFKPSGSAIVKLGSPLLHGMWSSLWTRVRPVSPAWRVDS